MASTTKVPLGADTLNRKWCIDVNSGTYDSPTWVGVFGVLEFKPVKDPTEQDSSDFDSGGWGATSITALKWGAEFKVRRAVTTASALAYDPGQELLRAASNLIGSGNRVDIRYYEVTTSGPKAEAYRGYCTVVWDDDGGSNEDTSTVSVKLNGYGARTAITHPDGAPSAVPSLVAASPAGAATAGGTLITISGVGFTGTVATTGVKFDGTNATTWVVLNDNVIVAVAPAHAAGAAEIVVTNATGASTVNVSVTYA